MKFKTISMIFISIINMRQARDGYTHSSAARMCSKDTRNFHKKSETAKSVIYFVRQQNVSLFK